MLSKLSDLSVIAEHVDSDDCLVERWIGGLHKVVVKMLLVIQAIEPLQNPSSALLPQPQSFLPVKESGNILTAMGVTRAGIR